MEITVTGLSKRFGGQWLFKNLNHHFKSPGGWAITGPNGSGKTTLLHILSAMSQPSDGQVEYKLNGKIIDHDLVYRHLWLAAPYMELLEELTLKELFHFHFQLKPLQKGYTINQIVDRCQLSASLNKPVGKFSSGMKQRVKLAMGIFSDLPLILLDEPTSNLDQNGFDWYMEEVSKLADTRLIIISSNQPKEYGFCKHSLPLGNVIG